MSFINGLIKDLNKDFGLITQQLLQKHGLIEDFKVDALLEILNGELQFQLKNLKKRSFMFGSMLRLDISQSLLTIQINGRNGGKTIKM